MNNGSESLPRGIATEIAAMGAVFDPDVLARTRALFEPTIRTDMPQGGRLVKDVAYGANDRQAVDIYVPGASNAPVLVYIPGGGFVGGDKAGYRALGSYFARAGYLTVIANYRLAPDHPWPAGAQDAAAAMDWALSNAATYGGGPERVFLFGQSAGATHVASALFDAALRPQVAERVAGAVLVSGIYSVTEDVSAPNIRQYFGEDVAAYEHRSPISHAAESTVPLLLMFAEYDPFFLGAPTLELAREVYARDGIAPRLVRLADHNHVSTVFGIGSEGDAGGPAILEFLAALRGYGAGMDRQVMTTHHAAPR